MSLGKNIAFKRKKQAWTQKHLASLMNVSDKTISSWENERTYPDVGSLVLLSEISNLSLDELIKEDLNMVKNLDRDLKDGRRWKKWKWLGGVTAILISGFILLNLAWFLRINQRQAELDNYPWENEVTPLPEHLSFIGYYIKSNNLYVYLSSYKTKYSVSYLDFDTAVRQVRVSDEEGKTLALNTEDEIIFYNGKGSYLKLNRQLKPTAGKTHSKAMTKAQQKKFLTNYQADIKKYYAAGIKVFSDLN